MQNKEVKYKEKMKSKKANSKVIRQVQFDKKHDKVNTTTEQEKQEKKKDYKKTFDKKTYRLKKYSNKYKLQEFEQQRRKRLLNKYYKSMKNELVGTYKPLTFDAGTTDSNPPGRFVRHPDLIEKQSENQKPKVKKPAVLKNAQERIKSIKEKSLNHESELLKAKEEREKRYAEYKKKKQERYKMLNVKNKKGQPVLVLKMEKLLADIHRGSSESVAGCR